MHFFRKLNRPSVLKYSFKAKVNFDSTLFYAIALVNCLLDSSKCYKFEILTTINKLFGN